MDDLCPKDPALQGVELEARQPLADDMMIQMRKWKTRECQQLKGVKVMCFTRTKIRI